MKKRVGLLFLLIIIGFCLIILVKFFITPNITDKEEDKYYQIKDMTSGEKGD